MDLDALRAMRVVIDETDRTDGKRFIVDHHTGLLFVIGSATHPDAGGGVTLKADSIVVQEHIVSIQRTVNIVTLMTVTGRTDFVYPTEGEAETKYWELATWLAARRC